MLNDLPKYQKYAKVPEGSLDIDGIYSIALKLPTFRFHTVDLIEI
jgi:hypothetical protein